MQSSWAEKSRRDPHWGGQNLLQHLWARLRYQPPSVPGNGGFKQVNAEILFTNFHLKYHISGMRLYRLGNFKMV